MADDSYVLSPETGSTVSSSGDGNGAAAVFSRPRETLNIFLNQCQIQPLGRRWLDWDKASERTRQRYAQRTSEIVSTVMKVISPVNAPHLWKVLQSSNIVNQQLGAHQAYLPSDRAYLEALAEAYKNSTSWDTRRQLLSVMAGVASFSAISEFIPGLTQYRYATANLHHVQYGRCVPVPSEKAPRIRIDLQQLDHFLGFITSPHLVQDLPFGEKHLQLSSGQIITVPNVIRTMIPERIIMQYTQYCAESNFKPLSRSTMLAGRKVLLFFWFSCFIGNDRHGFEKGEGGGGGGWGVLANLGNIFWFWLTLRLLVRMFSWIVIHYMCTIVLLPLYF